MSKQEAIDTRARQANDPDLWDKLWSSSAHADWRAGALSQVYTRIERAMPEGVALVVDIGGGQGDLALILQQPERPAEVWDHSGVALTKASGNGIHGVRIVDLEEPRERREAFDSLEAGGNPTAIVCTELLEHLTAEARADILARSAAVAGELGAFFSVPNARLAPEEEHQHTIEFTAVTFAAELRAAFGDRSVRVAALGPFLLGICGKIARKGFTLSMCLPVRDEEAELEKVLASFREVADEIVVGIDPRSVDGSRAIAERYADVVFTLDDPAAQEFFELVHEEERKHDDGQDCLVDFSEYEPHGLKMTDSPLPPEGVHFAWVRNQCMRRCTSDWIFMTEGHERLIEGESYLLNLDRIATADGRRPDVVSVARQGNRQRWAFPWLCRNDPARFYYVRGTHNTLEYPRDTVMVAIPQVVTLHERDHDNAMKRAEQRQAQNRDALEDDWERMANPASLFYLGQELRADDPEKAAEHLELYLEQEDGNGLTRYQARLMLAKILARRFRACRKEAAEVLADGNTAAAESYTKTADELEDKTRRILLGATLDDPYRTEHWVWLGDVAFGGGRLEEALMFYRYAGTLVGAPPFGPWWIDMDLYGYLPAQRLAQVYSHLGRGPEAVEWASRVVAELPADSPAWALEEARGNLKQLEEAVAELGLDDPLTVAEVVTEELEELPADATA
jgi:tetratricopeptide (TPR) repeat protein